MDSLVIYLDTKLLIDSFNQNLLSTCFMQNIILPFSPFEFISFFLVYQSLFIYLVVLRQGFFV